MTTGVLFEELFVAHIKLLTPEERQAFKTKLCELADSINDEMQVSYDQFKTFGTTISEQLAALKPNVVTKLNVCGRKPKQVRPFISRESKALGLSIQTKLIDNELHVILLTTK